MRYRMTAKYQSIFHSFPYFNIVQSTVFEDAFYTDKPLVVCAPTGSGKTVVFELCIIRLLILITEQNNNPSKFKIVYMAPVKSLCNERYLDWKSKFEPLGVLCIQLTGDSENEDYFELQKYSLILTTPEKWDSVTRLWKNNKVLIQMVKLLLIDEIHLLNEEERGATMEATLSRMKTIQFILSCSSSLDESQKPNFRFVAASATFPNVEDVAEWLSTPNIKGVFYKLNENLRPVCLKRVVIGYPLDSKSSEFKFDLMLSYKLNHVIQTYSENKPTLVFCSTRKSAILTACTLSKTSKFVVSASHKALLIDAANRLHDSTLRDCILNGIGFHHGGLDVSDRRLLEDLFLSSQLLVLVSTSTLSMGVNFPAHLVVIKSTSQYVAGCYKEYSDMQMLQMIGRAGRPQFDSNATAVIMTKSSLQAKYESLINGTQLIESSLHKHMAEHLNVEITLNSISDVSIAMEWLRATFLYQRVFKNPKYYGMNGDLTKDKIERKLQDICIKELNGLRKFQLISMDDDGFNLQPTQTGRLMAKYYIAYETMKKFYYLTGNENLADMINVLASCKEFDDIQLRVNEKRSLNDLNKSKLFSIRFPLQGKIKTKQMKINCLIQATLGCLTISEPSLNQDAARIFRNAPRISRCLVEYLSTNKKGFIALHSAVILSKCFKVKLWENSKFVSRQLEKIGVTFSNLLVNAGITTISDILKTNPREIELILKRNPPFGAGVIDSARQIPKYSLQVEQNFPVASNIANLSITVQMENIDDVLERKNGQNEGCYILIGDADNSIVLFQKIRNVVFFKEQWWTKKIDIMKAKKGNEINIYVISDSFVGMDIYKSYSIVHKSDGSSQNAQSTCATIHNEKPVKKPTLENNNQFSKEKTRNCNHKCVNKSTCYHSCCKTGVAVALPKKSFMMSNFMEQLQNKVYDSPEKVKIGVGTFSENIKMFHRNNNNSAKNSYIAVEDNLKHVAPKNIMLCGNKNKENNYDNALQDGKKLEKEVDLKNCEENNLQNLSFDINFQTNYLEDQPGNEYENTKEVETPPTKKLKYVLFPEKTLQRKLEKWDDPVAAEETFNWCLKFLSSQYR